MEKDDSFWLNICYLMFAVLIAYIVWQAIAVVGVQTSWSERYESWYAPMGYALSVAVGMGATWYLRGNAERNDYLLASIGELRKVSWPSMEDTRRMTIIVCVVVAVFAAIMLAFDLSWSFVLKGIIAAFD